MRKQHFCWMVLLQGFKNSPTLFGKVLAEAFSDLELEQGTRTSLVAQWLRICLPTQGTPLQALVQEDPTCRRASEPACHNH